MESNGFPRIPEGLIQALETIFPNALPSNPHWSERDIAVRQGHQEVIRFLKATAEDQFTDLLGDSV